MHNFNNITKIARLATIHQNTMYVAQTIAEQDKIATNAYNTQVTKQDNTASQHPAEHGTRTSRSKTRTSTAQHAMQ